MSTKTNNVPVKSPLKSRSILNQGLRYFILFVLVVICYGLLVSGLSIIFYGVSSPASPFIPGIVAFITAVGFLPLQKSVNHLLDKVFQRGNAGYQRSMSQFSDEIENLVKIEDILTRIRSHCIEQLSPHSIHVYYFDPIHEQYLACLDEKGEISSELRFSGSSPFVKMLLERNGPIFLSGNMYEKRILQTDRTRLSMLGANMVYPLQGSKRLLGWVVFGSMKGEKSYQSNELNYIDQLCRLAAQAIERTQIITNLEERVKHLNVLTRISQGINITINLDDILELIFAQTTQLIPATDLSIIVLDRVAQKYIQVFCVIDDERIHSNENQSIEIQDRLENYVISNQKPLLTPHYERECLRRGVEPYTADLSAWLSVPLLSGAEIIGTMTIGRRDLDGVYTRTQVGLLEAIADQVAGALEKSRLLTETARRAQQLSSLNEISRKLTSNLDFESLLKNILQSAVQILLCEAGMLYLYDEDTNELDLQVFVGPLKEPETRRFLPQNAGLISKTIFSRNAVRTNDEIEIREDQYPAISMQDEHEINACLIVPLLLKDRIIGVIQIINKADRSPISHEDEELLLAFAAQASISIENARLYTQTDQKLEARVKELSVLQRVGRELNATLDSGQALNITLNWAMSQSGFETGLIAMLEENKIKVVASSGFDQDISVDEDGFLQRGTSDLWKLIENGKAKITLLEELKIPGLFSRSNKQIFIPIERESVCTGFLIIETDMKTPVDPELVTFLQRLIDQASISIANAQLYSAVQKANVAKSEFVSFVSHELKNPMTSIKGYTELLAAGAVGPVNDAQQNFLVTIRSNVDRMATLVSDLADESRIEAGRLRLDFEAVSLKSIFEEVIRSEGKLVEEKNLVLTVNAADDLPMVWADYTRLVQITANLVSNARKYTPEGGHIKVMTDACINRWDENGARDVILVSIQDDGLGMKMEDQEKIFQKFFRSDDVKTREVPGTGLGLNITKSLVEAQGGKIWFESEFRKGTTFYFSIPTVQQ